MLYIYEIKDRLNFPNYKAPKPSNTLIKPLNRPV
jgi:hypothetical protein